MGIVGSQIAGEEKKYLVLFNGLAGFRQTCVQKFRVYLLESTLEFGLSCRIYTLGF